MDNLKSKLDVILWIADCKATVTKSTKKILVEINHNRRMVRWYMSAPDEKSLIPKIDSFIVSKMAA